MRAETGMADDCALAGYYSRLLGILLSRSAEQILSYMKASCLHAVHCLLPRHTPSLSAVFGNKFMSFKKQHHGQRPLQSCLLAPLCFAFL